jgi:hypothetical protein
MGEVDSFISHLVEQTRRETRKEDAEKARKIGREVKDFSHPELDTLQKVLGHSKACEDIALAIEGNNK